MIASHFFDKVKKEINVFENCNNGSNDFINKIEP